MKRRDLEQHLKAHGCQFVRHGANHDMWNNPVLNLQAAVPRHNQIKFGTAAAICKELGIPAPTKR